MKGNAEQNLLFEDDKNVEISFPEWEGMPEFVQEKQEPYACINIRVRTEEDLKALSELLGFKLSNKTKSAWFPMLERGINAGKRWVDADEK